MPYRIIRTTGNMADLEKQVNLAMEKDPALRPIGGPYFYDCAAQWCQAMARVGAEPAEGEVRLREPGVPLRNGKG